MPVNKKELKDHWARKKKKKNATEGKTRKLKGNAAQAKNSHNDQPSPRTQRKKWREGEKEEWAHSVGLDSKKSSVQEIRRSREWSSFTGTQAPLCWKKKKACLLYYESIFHTTGRPLCMLTPGAPTMRALGLQPLTACLSTHFLIKARWKKERTLLEISW